MGERTRDEDRPQQKEEGKEKVVWTAWFRGGPLNCKTLKFKEPPPWFCCPVLSKLDNLSMVAEPELNPFGYNIEIVDYDRVHLDRRLRLAIYRVHEERPN